MGIRALTQHATYSLVVFWLFSCQLHIYSCQQKASLNSFHLFSHRDCPEKPKKNETCTSHPVQARGQALPGISGENIHKHPEWPTIAMLPNYINLTLSCLLLVIVIMSSYVIPYTSFQTPKLQWPCRTASSWVVSFSSPLRRPVTSPDVASLTPLLTKGSYVEGGSYYTYHMVSYRILSYHHIYICIHSIHTWNCKLWVSSPARFYQPLKSEFSVTAGAGLFWPTSGGFNFSFLALDQRAWLCLEHLQYWKQHGIDSFLGKNTSTYLNI